jgi:hypothetical protein
MSRRAFPLLLLVLLMQLVTSAYADTVTLAWDANMESNVAGYRVYRSDQAGAYTSQPLNGWTLWTSTSWTDSTVETSRTYYYVVRAVDFDAAESDNSNEIAITVGGSATAASDLIAHSTSFSNIPTVPLTQSGRVYAEIQGPVNTAITIDNPSTDAVALDFYFADASGTELYSNRKFIPGNGRVSAFLSEPPFAPPPWISLSNARTLTFLASTPVAVTAVRGFTNERSEFLISPLPVAELNAGAGFPIVLPYNVNGDEWVAEVQLVNPSNAFLSGAVTFIPAAGPTSDLIYQIAPRSAASLRVPLTGSQPHAGWIRVTPFNGTPTPSGFLILSLHEGGITVSETGIQAVN